MAVQKYFSFFNMVNTLFKELIRPLPKSGRLLFLDYARGLALIFMIYNHALRNFSAKRWYARGDIMEFQNIGSLLMKGAPPLFIITFGFLIAYIYTDDARKNTVYSLVQKFWLKAGIIFIAYRLCAYFESLGRKLSYHFNAVGDTHWIEILMFYVILLLLTPFVIIAYKKIPSILFFMISIGLIFFSLKISQAGYNNQFTFFPRDFNLLFFGLKGHFNFPIFPYIGVYFIGFLMGIFYRKCETSQQADWFISILFIVGLCLFVNFYLIANDKMMYHLYMIKNNIYKHPPNYYFHLYSVASAVVILSFAMINERYLGFKGDIISYMGKRPLFLFVTHFFLIFIVFKQIIGRLYTLSIGKALTYSCFTLVLCYLSLKAWNLIVEFIYQGRSKNIQNGKSTD
ncbi:MAG: acyltransferase [Deltaproteobacteria bacterium]|nr:acyltransferase [Deltaproteobacteria bacterium]